MVLVVPVHHTLKVDKHQKNVVMLEKSQKLDVWLKTNMIREESRKQVCIVGKMAGDHIIVDLLRSEIQKNKLQ